MLRDSKILEEIEHGDIVIEPFDLRQLGTNSYDVRLGPWYYRPASLIWGGELAVNDELAVKRFWGQAWKMDYGLTIPPGATYLCHTMEKIGGREHIATQMKARSSMARMGISICKCAGLGDVGYINHWTMEVTNHLNVTVSIPLYSRVAQILFFDVGPSLSQYEGKYVSKGEWSPEDMLPRLWEDWEYKP